MDNHTGTFREAQARADNTHIHTHIQAQHSTRSLIFCMLKYVSKIMPVNTVMSAVINRHSVFCSLLWLKAHTVHKQPDTNSEKK